MKLGRKTGGTNSRHKLDKHKELIRTMVEYGYSKAAICRKVKCQYSTLDKHLEREGLIVRNYTPRPRKPKDIPTEKKNRSSKKKEAKSHHQEKNPNRPRTTCGIPSSRLPISPPIDGS